jgi:AcrR family transcriptional regulator
VAKDPSRASQGRPRIRDDHEILEAALRAFAASGYDAMSVRELNARLGLSHQTVSQRFGSKLELWSAAVDHGFADFFAAIARERATRPPVLDDIEELRETVRTFILAAATCPEIGRLINQEGLQATDRLAYIMRTGFGPGTRPLVTIVRRLSDAGVIRPTSARELFFLAQAGAAPFTHAALSSGFDEIDGPLDPEVHVERVADLIVRGLRTEPS